MPLSVNLGGFPLVGSHGNRVDKSGGRGTICDRAGGAGGRQRLVGQTLKWAEGKEAGDAGETYQEERMD